MEPEQEVQGLAGDPEVQSTSEPMLLMLEVTARSQPTEAGEATVQTVPKTESDSGCTTEEMAEAAELAADLSSTRKLEDTQTQVLFKRILALVEQRDTSTAQELTGPMELEAAMAL